MRLEQPNGYCEFAFTLQSCEDTQEQIRLRIVEDLGIKLTTSRLQANSLQNETSSSRKENAMERFAVCCMKLLLKALVVILVIPMCLSAQDDDNWPSLSYLKNDYKAVSVVAHVRVQQAEITGRIGGYENWKVSAVVIESFKGKLKKGDLLDYFHGAEAGLKREYFNGEKIVFLLSERDPKTKEIRYSVLENSTLQSTPDRVSKLRLIKRQSLKFHPRHS